MSHHNKIILLIPFLALAISCNKTKHEEATPKSSCKPVEQDTTNCSSWGPAIGVASISGVTTATVGQTVSLSVMVTARDGCGIEGQVIGTTTGNTTTLTGNIFSVGCMCTQALLDHPATYSFTPTQPGTYVFNGETYEGNPLTHTIVVQ